MGFRMALVPFQLLPWRPSYDQLKNDKKVLIGTFLKNVTFPALLAGPGCLPAGSVGLEPALSGTPE